MEMRGGDPGRELMPEGVGGSCYKGWWRVRETIPLMDTEGGRESTRLWRLRERQ